MKRCSSARVTTILRPMRPTRRRPSWTARSNEVRPMRATLQASSRVRKLCSAGGSGVSATRVLVISVLSFVDPLLAVDGLGALDPLQGGAQRHLTGVELDLGGGLKVGPC